MLRHLLIVVALLAACGAAVGSAAGPADPLVLVGWWREVATGEVVVIDPSRLEVRDPASATPSTPVAEGSWVGDSEGRFLARSYGVPPGAATPAWLGAAAGFTVDGGARVLLDRAGSPVARLIPAAAGGVSSATDPGRPPSDLERRASTPAAPLPAGLRPTAELTGRWVPVEQSGKGGAFVEFAADGTWTGTDGCTGTGGSWLAGPDGAFLATATLAMTFVACPGVGVAQQVGTARRVGLDGSTLVLLDPDGVAIGRYQRT